MNEHRVHKNWMASVTFIDEFESEYLRNNKTNNNKNLLCFPGCNPETHGKTFCGKSIKISLEFIRMNGDAKVSSSNGVGLKQMQDELNQILESLVLVGELQVFKVISDNLKSGLADREADKEVNVWSNSLSHLGTDSIERSEIDDLLVQRPQGSLHYLGNNLGNSITMTAERGSLMPKFSMDVEFNAAPRCWQYKWISSKHVNLSRHAFAIRLFLRNEKTINRLEFGSNYRIIGIARGPEFKIGSKRRAAEPLFSKMEMAVEKKITEKKAGGSALSSMYRGKQQTLGFQAYREIDSFDTSETIGSSDSDSDDDLSTIRPPFGVFSGKLDFSFPETRSRSSTISSTVTDGENDFFLFKESNLSSSMSTSMKLQSKNECACDDDDCNSYSCCQSCSEIDQTRSSSRSSLLGRAANAFLKNAAPTAAGVYPCETPLHPSLIKNPFANSSPSSNLLSAPMSARYTGTLQSTDIPLPSNGGFSADSISPDWKQLNSFIGIIDHGLTPDMSDAIMSFFDGEDNNMSAIGARVGADISSCPLSPKKSTLAATRARATSTFTFQPTAVQDAKFSSSNGSNSSSSFSGSYDDSSINSIAYTISGKKKGRPINTKSKAVSSNAAGSKQSSSKGSNKKASIEPAFAMNASYYDASLAHMMGLQEMPATKGRLSPSYNCSNGERVLTYYDVENENSSYGHDLDHDADQEDEYLPCASERKRLKKSVTL